MSGTSTLRRSQILSEVCNEAPLKWDKFDLCTACLTDVYYAAKTARAHTNTCRSPLFGSDAFGFQVVLNLQPARAGRSVEISLLLLPRPQTLQSTLQSASSVFFSLTIKNQKDDDLSITMDEEREIDGDSHGDLSELGFQHFMTFDLLMDRTLQSVKGRGIINICFMSRILLALR